VEVTWSVIRDVVSSNCQESSRRGIASGKKRVKNVVFSIYAQYTHPTGLGKAPPKPAKSLKPFKSVE
jgi:hypothetical protein